MKVLEENLLKWPSIIVGVLFAHRVSKHPSTKHSPFNLLDSREPVLTKDVKYKLSSAENSDPDEHIDRDTFDAVLASSNIVRKVVQRQAGENIKRIQKKQQRACESHNKSSASNDIYIDAEVVLRNNNLRDGKGGKFTFN